MKREIKFRSKRLDNGEWVEGSLLQDDYGTCMIVEFADHHEQWHEVDPETVGQFTGMKDKNSVDIYEDDIIGGSNGSINGIPWPFSLHIQWNDKACEFNTPNWGYMDSTHYYEVIGNIHDNPELLKTE